MEKMNEKKIDFILYQIHIPKTGGSSLRSYLRDNIGEAACGTIGTPYSKISPMPSIGTFVHMHNGFFNIHKLIDTVKYKYIITIRDPIKRFCSLCMQELNNPNKPYNAYIHDIAKRTNTKHKVDVPSIFWDELIEYLKKNTITTTTANEFCLTLSTTFDHKKRVVKLSSLDEQLDAAIININTEKDNAVFVFTDDFQQSLKKAIQKLDIHDLPDWNRKYDCVRNKIDYTMNFQEYHNNELTPFFVHDFKLYNHILKNFKDQA